MLSYTDSDILAFVKGELAKDKAEQLESAMLASNDLADRVAEIRGSLLPIKEAFLHEFQAPTPESLNALLAGQPTGRSSKHIRPTWLVAACALAGLFLGGLILNQFGPTERSFQTNSSTDVQKTAHIDWVERVADYQSLYTESTVGALKPDATEQANVLLARISAQTMLKTALPDLSKHGYSFARAQELGFNGEALVQLVYSKPGSAPLAFCYMRAASGDALPVEQRPYHQLNTASWQLDGQRYVLVAEESAASLASMTESLQGYF